MRTLTRLALGAVLTAAGALALHEAWGPPAAGYAAVFAGLALTVVAMWRWLERDVGRRVRWSDEHRARVLSWAGRSETRPAAPTAVDSQAPVRMADDGELQPAAVGPIGAGPAREPDDE